MEKLVPRVVVIGAGQVGTFAARALQDAGWVVVAADKDPAPGFFARFGPRRPVDLLEVDMTSGPALLALFTKVRADAVVLCAGLVGDQCDQNADLAWRVNVGGAEAVAKAAQKAGVHRLVYLSSLAIYGRPPGPSVFEDEPQSPRSHYGRTKAAAEAVLNTARDRGLDVVILRPCGTYGPIRVGRGSRSARLVEAALLLARRTGECRIDTTRGVGDELLYVKDLARAIAIATRTRPRTNHVYNVGVGRLTTVLELRRAVAQAVPGATLTLSHLIDDSVEPMPPLNTDRIWRAFRFAPRFDLASGFRDYAVEAALE